MASADHFEIPVDDIARAQAFYKSVLDFDYTPWGEEMGMLEQPEGAGINGDLHLRGGLPHPTIVFTVEDIDATLELVRANGGDALGEVQPMGETSRWVYIRDSEGNIVGLFDERGTAA